MSLMESAVALPARRAVSVGVLDVRHPFDDQSQAERVSDVCYIERPLRLDRNVVHLPAPRCRTELAPCFVEASMPVPGTGKPADHDSDADARQGRNSNCHVLTS